MEFSWHVRLEVPRLLRSVCREFGIHFDVIVGLLELFPSSPSEDCRLMTNLHGSTYLTECLHVCVCVRLPAG